MHRIISFMTSAATVTVLLVAMLVLGPPGMALGQECHHCETESCIYSTHHETLSGGTVVGPDHSCKGPYAMTCPHNTCAPQEEEEEDAEDADDLLNSLTGAMSADPAALWTVVVEFPDRILLHAKHQALVVLGCGNEIHALVPLQPAQFAALIDRWSD